MASVAQADDRAEVSTAVFSEQRAGGKGGLTVVHPQVDLGTDIGNHVSLDIGYAADRDKARDRIRSLVSPQRVRVLCSQGDTIPDLVRWWAAKDGMRLSPARTRKGSVWVLSFSGERLVAADHLDRSLSVDTAPAVTA